MIINHNLNAMNAHRQMGINTGTTGKAIEKLSSGLRINRAGDDAAGLSISEKMRGQIRGLDQASRNSQDGISLIQTAEGALNETHSIIQRMRELAVQASNGTNLDEDREQISKEFEQLQKEITRIASDAEFNKQKLLNGDLKGSLRKDLTAASIQDIKVSSTDLETSAYDLTTSATDMKASADEKLGSVAEKQTEADKKMDEYNKKMASADEKADANPTSTSGADLRTSAADLLRSAEELAKSVEEMQASADEKLGSVAEKQASAQAKTEEAKAKLETILDKDSGMIFQVGANAGQTISVQIQDMRASALGIDAGTININDFSSAQSAIKKLDAALTKVSDQRSTLGAVQNRLEHTIASTDNTSENLQAAESRIRDVDMAKEMMNYTKSNILTQAAQSMLAQANQAPNNVLQLLQ